MARLLIFNPDHDYALASSTPYYTPPVSIRTLSKSLEFLPAIWSVEGDFILLNDNSVAEINIKSDGEIEYIRYAELECLKDRIYSIEPWGWDQRIANRLINLGFEKSLIPDNIEMENLRRLSHRRISIWANKYLHSPFVPMELSTEQEALDFVRKNPGCYFKLPWSSGGRGVLATKELNQNQILEWVKGGLRRQGSIMGEKGIERSLDFASLWSIENRDVRFEGMSISWSDGRGKYNGNYYADSQAMMNYIAKHVPGFKMEILSRQQGFLSRYISPFYEGKIGIDMMADQSGTVYPCVEINLRRTMGHVAIDFNRLSNTNKQKFTFDSLKFIPL